MICGESYASCSCINTDCRGVHRCECGGSWRFDLQGNFHIERLPEIWFQDDFGATV